MDANGIRSGAAKAEGLPMMAQTVERQERKKSNYVKHLGKGTFTCQNSLSLGSDILHSPDYSSTTKSSTFPIIFTPLSRFYLINPKTVSSERY